MSNHPQGSYPAALKAARAIEPAYQDLLRLIEEPTPETFTRWEAQSRVIAERRNNG